LHHTFAGQVSHVLLLGRVGNRMTSYRTSRHSTHGVDRVSARCWANREDVTFDVGGDVLSSRNGVRGFLVFQGPLLFGPIDLAEIVDAHVEKVDLLGLLRDAPQLLILRLQLLQLLDLLLLHARQGGLGRLRLLGKLLTLVAQPADFIPQPEQVFLVLAQLSNLRRGYLLGFQLSNFSAQGFQLLYFGLQFRQLGGLGIIARPNNTESAQCKHGYQPGKNCFHYVGAVNRDGTF